MSIIVNTLFDKIVEDNRFIKNIWASISYISMIDEWKKEECYSEKDLLKDNMEEKNAFVKNSIDERSPECFSQSVKSHISYTKINTIKLLSRLLKYTLDKYEADSSYMVVEDPH